MSDQPSEQPQPKPSSITIIKALFVKVSYEFNRRIYWLSGIILRNIYLFIVVLYWYCFWSYHCSIGRIVILFGRMLILLFRKYLLYPNVMVRIVWHLHIPSMANIIHISTTQSITSNKLIIYQMIKLRNGILILNKL